YTPSRPSPLSERSANALPHAFTFSMASSMQDEKKLVTAPQRAYKPNPVVLTRDAATKRRRDMFFKRVQREREDKKWDSRGEQIQRLDYFSDHKRWEAEKAREAPQVEDYIIEEEVADELPSSYTSRDALQPEREAEEAEYIIAQEEYELQELIASMEEQQETASQHYGSDDEDYDSIFMECASATDTQLQPQEQTLRFDASFNDADEMDM
ncbi:hypothetical protein K458DRAFT_240106, partial [Lentithecium fluviatile CBS 122367]